MKAVEYTAYGPPDVLHLTERAKPTPKEHEVLVRVRATTVTIGDVRMRSFTVPRRDWLFARLYLGITGPRRTILGMELSGDIETIGKKVTRFKPGDPVFASTFGVNFGGYAEYKCLPEDGMLAVKPANCSYEEAAAIPGGGMTALRLLKKADIQSGQRALIYGASGAVGTNAVQLAKHFGATVTGVCSTANLALVRSLGADAVIDYTKEDFAQSSEPYDVVIDAVGKISAAQEKRVGEQTATYLNVLKDSGGKEHREDLIYLKELVEAEQLRVVIDRTYPLEQVPEAHRYVEKGHKKGNVAVSVSHGDEYIFDGGS
jgi:NADPH:quinone reductase-like Zn-dependent oxidoreductase